MSLDSASNGAKHSQLFFDCQEQLTGIRQTYKSILKYREENVTLWKFHLVETLCFPELVDLTY
jgi:hypothetical protein